MAGSAAKRAAAGSRRRTMRVRSGDQVQVVSGKDRGKRGRVLRVDSKHERVFVEGLNMRKRHIRPQQTQEGIVPGTAAQLGGVIESEGPIHVSNVMLLDPKGGKPTRVGVEREDGKPFRVAKGSGTRID
jgi:large subunit ribosomal protein L24